jgi:catechol 2,3-dioxygenase-like lactoylglutathione lyase family enzyme
MSTFKLDHVAFGVPDVTPVAAVLGGEWGGGERGSGPGGGFVFWQWEFAGGGVIEIIVPDGPPDGFLHRFLAARGPGPHHITFKVLDIRAALGRAREQGYDPVGFDDRDPGWIEAFLHPKQAQGIVVQLAQAQYELDEGEADGGYERPPFPETAAATERVRVVGLRLASRSEARARAQWETTLGGSLSRDGHDLVFHWPESPLRIAVSVQPEAAEGPLALELSAGRRLALPEGPHPALGLPLVQIEEPKT